MKSLHKTVMFQQTNKSSLKNRLSTKYRGSRDFNAVFLKIIYYLSILGLIGTIIGSLMLISTFIVFSGFLPSPSKLTNREVEQSTKIFSKNGELLYSVFDEKNRTLVTLEEVSPHLVNATLATEDGDFFQHQGIDPFGIARGLYKTATKQGRQGGSTLTQQIAKNALLSSERTITRKIKDVVLALQIENTYSKREILQIYINEVPYGGSVWGVEAASKTYFDKSAKDLTLAEAALIAGLPQSPTRYNPFANPAAAKDRQRTVLRLMRENGWIDENGVSRTITEEEYSKALEEDLDYKDLRGRIRAPHFVMYVLQLLEERYGDQMVVNGGLQVKTSIDLSLQDEYQKIVQEEIEKISSLGVGNGSLIAIDPKTRGILAMVGSKNYFDEDADGQFNTTLSLRQPGSTLKPIIYLTGLVRGYTASTVLYDVQTGFPQGPGLDDWHPVNYGNWGFRGPIQVRFALANSVNIPAVKMLDLVGIPNFVKLAQDLGIKSLNYDPSKHGLAIALGGVEVKLIDLTNGFSSLASKGRYKPVQPILEVTDPNGRTLEKAYDFDEKQVVDERYVWILSDIISDNNSRLAAFGPRSQLYFPKDRVAAKTGTSNDFKDNWTVGYTSDIAIGVWVGNNDGTPMNSRLVSGITGAAPIWNRAMNRWLEENPHQSFERPDGIIEMEVGKLTGMALDDDREESRKEYYVEGTEPKAVWPIFQKVQICKDGEVKSRTYTVYQANQPEWQDALTDWIKETYKDDESQMKLHLGPEYVKEVDPELFDIDDCNEDDD